MQVDSLYVLYCDSHSRYGHKLWNHVKRKAVPMMYLVMYLVHCGVIVLAVTLPATAAQARRARPPAPPPPPPRVDVTAAIGDRTGQRLQAELARRMAAGAGAARGGWGRASSAATPPPPLDVPAATGDRTGQRLDAELARRAALARRQPDSRPKWPNLTMCEIHLEDENLFDWIPDFPAAAAAANASAAAQTRRVTNVKTYWRFAYFTNYMFDHPPDKDVIKKLHSMMREKLYGSREMLDDLKPLYEKYATSLKMRFAFVFKRLENLLQEMMAIYSFSWHFQDWRYMTQHLYYHEHLLRRHVDIMYITERTIHMYNWYKERERRLNSVLAARLTTPAQQPTFDLD